ncbi:SapC family protein [Metallibacterium scheffleri]|uniref:Multidrug transporter n=1 Tax=Metallibacterium scheffleri TaxID=993689 RepID=A0A4S3KR81_9GAMM|nr:SapC family protein [Metallibacterium scheffleri]THD11587.1 hypothetical protein B1806_02960 [Metallibacterium scheffleri]
MKTLLIYDRPVPLNRELHRHWRLRANAHFTYVATLNALPLVGFEFALAARDYPVVFAGASAAQALPVALVGLRADENLHVDAEGRWSECYIPAFVRRYPYALAADGERFQVVLDEAWPGFNTEEGDPLFDSEGNESESLKRTLGFLEEYQSHIRTTQAFVGELNRLGLLESRQLQRATSADEPAPVLTGLWMINEDKLKALPADQAQALLKNGALGWIYAHLLSLVNLDRLGARLAQRSASAASAA